MYAELPVRLRAASICLLALQAQTANYELTFYHHYPDESTVCFTSSGNSTGSNHIVGPLSYGDVHYRTVDFEVADVYVDAFASTSGTECGSNQASLIAGPRKARLVPSASNTFGLAVKDTGRLGLDANRAVESTGNPRAVNAGEINLMFWNGARGVDNCIAEIRENNRTWWVVGPIRKGAGKEVSVGCSTFNWATTSFVFTCNGREYEYMSGADSSGTPICMGASQQVTLIGDSDSRYSHALAVTILGGTNTCSCSKRCTSVCTSKTTRGMAVDCWIMSFVLLLSFGGPRRPP